MKRLLLLLVLLVMLAGCNSTPVAPEISSDGPRVWLDAPLNNSTLPLAPLEIVSHASDPLRVTQVELSVNGSPLRTDPNLDATKSLVTTRQPWSPPAPGNYTLLVRAMNSASVWSEYAQALVVIGGTTGGVVQGAVYADLNGDGDTNDASEGPLDDVTVTLTGCANKTTQTDEGNFEFTGLPSGTCLVSVAKTGWKFVSTFPTGIGYPAKAVSDPNKPTAFSIVMTPEVVKQELPVVTPQPGTTRVPPVTITYLADPATITSGQCTTIRWQVTNASKVFLDDAQVEASGTKPDCPKQNATHTLRLITLDNQTVTRTITINVTQPPVVNTSCTGSASIASFSASDTSITKGSSTKLNWGTVSNADSIEIDQGVGKYTAANKVVAAGSKTVTPAQTTTYTLTARCGTTAITRQVTITVSVPVAPKCSGTPNIASFATSATSTTPGKSVTLSWGAVTNADSVEIDPGIGGVATPGSRQVTPSQMTTYTLTARCGSSVATRQVKITVISAIVIAPKCSGTPTIASFYARPSSVSSGKSATLSWGTISNSDSIEINQGIGTVTAPGSRSVSPTKATTYTLTARCGSNAVTRQATVNVTYTLIDPIGDKVK
jgi:hypothetical protein